MVQWPMGPLMTENAIVTTNLEDSSTFNLKWIWEQEGRLQFPKAWPLDFLQYYGSAVRKYVADSILAFDNWVPP